MTRKFKNKNTMPMYGESIIEAKISIIIAKISIIMANIFSKKVCLIFKSIYVYRSV